jgi:hypothetical protein
MRSTGSLRVGMRVKSGQSALLNMFSRRARAHSREAWMVTGLSRRPMIRSAISGRSFT